MGLRSAARAVKVWWQWRRLEGALEREARMDGYDPKKTLLKALRALGAGALSVVLAALMGYLTDSAAMAAALREAGLSDALNAALVPLLLAGGAAARNALSLASAGSSWWVVAVAPTPSH